MCKKIEEKKFMNKKNLKKKNPNFFKESWFMKFVFIWSNGGLRERSVVYGVKQRSHFVDVVRV